MGSTEEIFCRHFSALRRLVKKNRYLSNLSYIWESAHYKEILSLAKEDASSPTVIKLLFQDLVKKSSWETLMLLLEILERNPAPEIRGNLPKMTEELILLGKKRGYL